MANIFVYCIGGSGLRVMKSIVMLLASGFKLNGTVVPVILDPHEDLDERKQLDALIERYTSIRNSLKCEQSGSVEGFFNTKIVPLNQLANTNFVGINNNQTFGQYCNVNALPANSPNRYLIKSLFSSESLGNSLRVGFKGNPNVGCVVLSEYVEKSPEYAAFVQNVSQGDSVFIVSSIFGGTGASGFPLLTKMIQGNDNNQALQNAPLGAVSILPYFKLSNNASSSIDSTTFLTKTKSALAYYENNVKPDYLYYVGEEVLETEFTNDEAKQQNGSHFIELVAASALFDFASNAKPEAPQCKTRAIENNVVSLNRQNIGDGYKEMIDQLSYLWTFSLLCDTLPAESQFPLRKTRKLDKDLYEQSDFKELKEFLSGTTGNFTTFQQWLQELKANNRSFNPINLALTADKELRELIFDKPFKEEKGEPFDISYILTEMIRKNDKAKFPKEEKKLRMLIALAYRAIQSIYNKRS